MPPSPPADERMGEASEETGVFNHIPVFLDRTFRMIENVPDDVVCWSEAGDSFIIKQVGAAERPTSWKSRMLLCVPRADYSHVGGRVGTRGF